VSVLNLVDLTFVDVAQFESAKIKKLFEGSVLLL